MRSAETRTQSCVVDDSMPVASLGVLIEVSKAQGVVKVMNRSKAQPTRRAQHSLKEVPRTTPSFSKISTGSDRGIVAAVHTHAMEPTEDTL
jgi:hypothetical protein